MSRQGVFWAVLALVVISTARAESADWVAVERAPLTEFARLDGVVEAVQRSTVSAQTSGTVVELPFDIEAVVEPGALIARLDDTEQQARVREAEAELAESQAALADASQQFERVETLFQRGVVSRSDFDQAQNSLNGARARLARSRSRIDAAREQLEYTKITAPYGGVVTERHVELGESVRPGQPLLSGLAPGEVRVVVPVPQRYAGLARSGARAVVTGNDGRRLNVDRVTVFPFADETTHVVRMRLHLDEPPGTVFPGTLVIVELAVAEREALWVPAASLLRRGELRAVYVRGPSGQPRLRQVRTGVVDGERIEVLSGLDEREQVATDPSRVFERVDEETAR